ncbi:F-box-like protein [Ceratobasidium sp. AG-Ba]|nr:F-box-like protein [Ceratobasidium sp. AG-Ba]
MNNRLPYEILVQIFSYAAVPDNCVPKTSVINHDGIDYNQSPLSLTRVCRFWNQVAVSLPALWSHVDVYGCTDPTLEICLRISRHTRLLLQHSEGTAIHLHFHDPPGPYDPERSQYIEPLRPYFPFVSSLKFSPNYSDEFVQEILDIYRGDSGPTSLKCLELRNTRPADRETGIRTCLYTIKPVRLPHGLVSLRLNWGHCSFCIYLDTLVQALLHCPQLHTLQINCLNFFDSEPPPMATIPLHYLRVLDLTSSYGSSILMLLSVISTGRSELALGLGFGAHNHEMIEAARTFLHQSRVYKLILGWGIFGLLNNFPTTLALQDLVVDLRCGNYKTLNSLIHPAGWASTQIAVKRLYIIDRHKIPNRRERDIVRGLINVCNPSEVVFIGFAVMGAPPFESWYDYPGRDEENMYEWLLHRVDKVVVDFPREFARNPGSSWNPLAVELAQELPRHVI